MKKRAKKSTSGSSRTPRASLPQLCPDELLPQYDAALIRKGARGKYAARYAESTNVVVLDPDIAAEVGKDVPGRPRSSN